MWMPVLNIMACEDDVKNYRHWVREELFKAMKWVTYGFLMAKKEIIYYAMRMCGTDKDDLTDAVEEGAVVASFHKDISALLRKTRYSSANGIRHVMICKLILFSLDTSLRSIKFANLIRL